MLNCTIQGIERNRVNVRNCLQDLFTGDKNISENRMENYQSFITSYNNQLNVLIPPYFEKRLRIN